MAVMLASDEVLDAYLDRPPKIRESLRRAIQEYMQACDLSRGKVVERNVYWERKARLLEIGLRGRLGIALRIGNNTNGL